MPQLDTVLLTRGCPALPRGHCHLPGLPSLLHVLESDLYVGKQAGGGPGQPQPVQDAE